MRWFNLGAMILLEPSERDWCWLCPRDEDVCDVIFEKDTGDRNRRRMNLCLGCRLELHDVTEPDILEQDVDGGGVVREIAL